MKVKDLREATRIWNLASLDMGVRGLTFDNEYVYFDGTHTGARYTLPNAIEGLTEPLVINGRTLMSTLSLLSDEDEITLIYKKPQVLFESKVARASVNASIGSSFLRESVQGPTVTVDRAKFALATRFAAAVASRVMTSPILTGIQMTGAKNRMILRATDAGGRACVTWVPAKGGEDMQMVLPAGDLASALECFASDEITIVNGGNIVGLLSGKVEVIHSTLAGKFPDLSKLPREYPYVVEMPSAALELIARAAATFDTDRLAMVKFRSGHTIIAARGEELGEFQSVVNSTAEVPDGFSLTFDATLIGVTTALGRKIKLHFRDQTTPVMMVGEDGGKVYWLSPVIVS